MYIIFICVQWLIDFMAIFLFPGREDQFERKWQHCRNQLGIQEGRFWGCVALSPEKHHLHQTYLLNLQISSHFSHSQESLCNLVLHDTCSLYVLKSLETFSHHTLCVLYRKQQCRWSINVSCFKRCWATRHYLALIRASQEHAFLYIRCSSQMIIIYDGKLAARWWKASKHYLQAAEVKRICANVIFGKERHIVSVLWEKMLNAQTFP